MTNIYLYYSQYLALNLIFSGYYWQDITDI